MSPAGRLSGDDVVYIVKLSVMIVEEVLDDVEVMAGKNRQRGRSDAILRGDYRDSTRGKGEV